MLLRDSLLLPPVKSAGSGLAPEVKVRVSIDERGRVVDVEVVSIRPASEYDEVFRESTIEELLSWRYAPAIEDGEPQATTLEWTVQYQANSDNVPINPARFLPPFLLVREDAEARHARLMSLPLEKKKEILLSYARIGEKYLDRSRRRQFETDRFVVVTDAESPESAGIVGRNLEVALGVVHRLLQPHIEPQPSRLKVLVYLYSRRSSFDAMRAELAGLVGSMATYYAPGLITYSLEVPSSEFLMSFLIHESCHAYSDHQLRRPGFPFPRWLEEGFAEYMGNSQVKKGQLLPGRTLKRKFVLNHFVPRVQVARTGAGWDLKRVQQALRKGEGLTLEELVSADRDIFYGDKSYLYYGTSWLFVHFLRHGEPEWAEESFPLLMLYLAEGYPARAALEAAYDADLEDLQGPFLKYVKSF